MSTITRLLNAKASKQFPMSHISSLLSLWYMQHPHAQARTPSTSHGRVLPTCRSSRSLALGLWLAILLGRLALRSGRLLICRSLLLRRSLLLGSRGRLRCRLLAVGGLGSRLLGLGRFGGWLLSLCGFRSGLLGGLLLLLFRWWLFGLLLVLLKASELSDLSFHG